MDKRQYSRMTMLLLLLLISSLCISLTSAINLDNEGIRRAVALWLTDQESALAEYGPIEEWSTWQVTDMSQLFQGATTFDANLDDWNVGSVTDMTKMFAGCSSFQSSQLTNWNVAQVTDFSLTFFGATNFTGESLGAWQTSSAVNMEQMFLGATRFVGPPNMGSWNVSRVTSLRGMFLGASSFNRDLSDWDISQVQNTDSFLERATNFGQRVCWKEIHPKARFYQAFCNVKEGGGFDLRGNTCPTVWQRPSLIAWSRACDPTDALEDIIDTQVFGRPEDLQGLFASGGLGAPEDSLVDVEDVSTTNVVQVEEDYPPTTTGNNSDTSGDGSLVAASVEREASAASLSLPKRQSLLLTTTCWTAILVMKGFAQH